MHEQPHGTFVQESKRELRLWKHQAGQLRSEDWESREVTSRAGRMLPNEICFAVVQLGRLLPDLCPSSFRVCVSINLPVVKVLFLFQNPLCTLSIGIGIVLRSVYILSPLYIQSLSCIFK